jgi:hypothetical protein
METRMNKKQYKYYLESFIKYKAMEIEEYYTGLLPLLVMERDFKRQARHSSFVYLPSGSMIDVQLIQQSVTECSKNISER